ncbi:MAG: response regulator transcription factor [Oscillospiraceae bacterium]|nr:response regulator transcription factor [Oscillospiraceae bacterium]
MSDKKTVLIVEDDPSIANIVEYHLKKAGYLVLKAFDGPAGLEMTLSERPDLVLLDIMLPLLDGFSVCRAIRERDPVTPVLLLTARGEEEDKVRGLELGADDYITKPFSTRELLARVRANMRRPRPEGEPETGLLEAGALTLDPGRLEVRRGGVPLELSQREFDLLLYLWQRRNKVVSREDLMEKVWGYEYYGDLRAVDVAVRRLREKLEENPAEPVYILTRRGAGYLFSAEG